MKYLGLAYYDERKFRDLPQPQLDALVSQCPALDRRLQGTGRLRLSASLGESAASISIRPVNGTPQVTDGPYTESKELVGGLFIIEADDLEQAIALASMHPAAQLGEDVGWGIELRPIDYYQQP